MYIAAIPNRNSPPAILLRESYRDGHKVKSRTLANLSKLPPEAIIVLRRVLQGEKLVSVEEAFEVTASYHHGHVQAVLLAMRQLAFPSLIAARPSRQRNLIQALVAARLLQPSSKLATTRWWHLTSLPALLDVADATEDDLYQAMDWLLERQARIEKKLAARHLQHGGLALYDLTSSYFEGVTCPLAAFGHDRDGRKGKLQVNYGLLTDRRGCPVAVSVFKGNTGDPKTLLPQVEKARKDFRIKHLVMVGDRGMITQKQIDTLREIEGLDWITALRPDAIKKLVQEGAIQMGLFDEHNLFELSHPDFPNERLVACRNPELALRRAGKRQSLIEATARELDQVARMVEGGRLRGQERIRARLDSILGNYRIGRHYRVDIRDDGFDFEVDAEAIAALAVAGDTDPGRIEKRRNRFEGHMGAMAGQFEKLRQRIARGRLHGKDKIGVRVGKVLDKYKVGKHFKLEIQDDEFRFEVDSEKVAAEAALDGLYVVRTSLAQERITPEDTVRGYKLLAQVERAYRCMKTVDLNVRPIRHRLEDRVRAHIFLCTLAYYVLWHMLEAWRPLLFCDEDQRAKLTRDPVAPAQRSQAALRKAHTKVCSLTAPRSTASEPSSPC
ncbi:IS1634 family transposase [Acidobacteria bacterium AH-259-O06]|nr:IS1634 family transposase [Acidobacteria bacterium AH-259-O06]